jgi:hypothetical protein
MPAFKIHTLPSEVAFPTVPVSYSAIFHTQNACILYIPVNIIKMDRFAANVD